MHFSARSCIYPLSVLIILTMFLTYPAVLLAQIHGVRIQEERSVGYLLGDSIARHIAIDHEPGWILQSASLPAPGAQNYWLELRSVATRQSNGYAGVTTYVDLDYQSFYTPIAVRTLELPALALRFTHNDRVANATVPPWSFTMAPLREVLLAGGKDWLTPRDDRLPRPVDTTVAGQRLLSAVAVAFITALWLARLYGCFPFSPTNQTPFAQAAYKLRRLSASDSLHRTYQYLHDAFNRNAGYVLMADDIERWLQENPAFECHRDRIQHWFEASRLLFFADDEGGAQKLFGRQKLQQLASDLAARERDA
ncbi:MAG: hypothetical protein ACK5ME_04800 [Parahaliea sp.]